MSAEEVALRGFQTRPKMDAIKGHMRQIVFWKISFWKNTVDRVKNEHCEKFKKKSSFLTGKISQICSYFHSKEVKIIEKHWSFWQISHMYEIYSSQFNALVKCTEFVSVTLTKKDELLVKRTPAGNTDPVVQVIK